MPIKEMELLERASMHLFSVECITTWKESGCASSMTNFEFCRDRPHRHSMELPTLVLMYSCLHVYVHVSWESARDTLTAQWNGNGFRSPGKTILVAIESRRPFVFRSYYKIIGSSHRVCLRHTRTETLFNAVVVIVFPPLPLLISRVCFVNNNFIECGGQFQINTGYRPTKI